MSTGLRDPLTETQRPTSTVILLRQKDLGRVGSSFIGGDIRAKVSQAVEAPAFDAST